MQNLARTKAQRHQGWCCQFSEVQAALEAPASAGTTCLGIVVLAFALTAE
jgi:hypothetical protein